MTALVRTGGGDAGKACELSIIIKALNEERNLDRTLQHALSATAGRDAEIIVADCLSTDRTIEIALKYPVQIVQLVDAGERSCGVGAQLGFQFASGRYLLVMDGDMDLQSDFVDDAISRLDQDSGLAGVGGRIVDLNFENLEYRARHARAARDVPIGPVDRLYGGGMFRREAIAEVGYLTNRNLHSWEELEQALRLRAAGWRLERLAVVAAHHHGHTTRTWTLMRTRWASRYVCGGGELLRAAIGQPWFWQALCSQRHLFAVLGWWVAAAGLLGIAIVNVSLAGACAALALLLLPLVLMSLRRSSSILGLYSVASWCFNAAGLVRGLLRRQRDPLQPIAAVVIAWPEAGKA